MNSNYISVAVPYYPGLKGQPNPYVRPGTSQTTCRNAILENKKIKRKIGLKWRSCSAIDVVRERVPLPRCAVPNEARLNAYFTANSASRNAAGRDGPGGAKSKSMCLALLYFLLKFHSNGGHCNHDHNKNHPQGDITPSNAHNLRRLPVVRLLLCEPNMYPLRSRQQQKRSERGEKHF